MSGTWTCGACSTTNESTYAHCVVCHIARGSAGTAPAAAASPTVPRVPVTSRPVAPAEPASPGAVPAGQGGVPLVPPTPPAAVATPPLDAPAGKRRVPVAAIAAILVLVLGIAAAVVVVGGGGSDGGTSDDVSSEYDSGTDYDSTDYDTSTDDSTADDGSSSTDYDSSDSSFDDGIDTSDTLADVPATVAEPEVRTASMHATFAKVRTEPRLDAGVAREMNAEGMGFDVLEEATSDGWYRVNVEGTEGYLFGAFVSPPSPGFCVGTSHGAKPRLYDEFGSTIGGELSGNKVLMTATEPTSNGWPVVMPAGQTGYVSVDDVSVDSCG